MFPLLTKPCFTCEHAAREIKGTAGEGRGHKVHHKTGELLRRTWNKPLMHSAPFCSLAGPSCVLLTEEVFAKDRQGMGWKGELINRSFSYNPYRHILIFHFLSLRSVKPRTAGKSHSSSVIKLLLRPPCLLATTADSILPCFICCLKKEELSRNNGAWWEKTQSEHRSLTVRDHFLI